MTGKIITIEISELIRNALIPVVGDSATVYARGVDTSAVSKAGTHLFPMVDIIPRPRNPQQHSSVFMAYPVALRLVTFAPDDEYQITLYTVADLLSTWLVSNPRLNLTLAKFDALVVGGSPEFGYIGQNDSGQFLEWELTVNARSLR